MGVQAVTEIAKAMSEKAKGGFPVFVRLSVGRGCCIVGNRNVVVFSLQSTVLHSKHKAVLLDCPEEPGDCLPMYSCPLGYNRREVKE